MTTITVDVRIGGGQPPSSDGGGKSYVLYAPRDIVNTAAGATIVPVQKRTELATDGTASVDLNALPADTPYAFQFSVDNGRWQSAEILVIVPASGTHKLADLVALGDDFQPPAWYSQVIGDADFVRSTAAGMPALVEETVTQDIAGRDLIEQRRGYAPGPPIGGLVDQDGNLTELVFDGDGRVPDSILAAWGPRISPLMPLPTADGYTTGAVGGLTDKDGNLTELIFDSRGEVPASIAKKWFARAGGSASMKAKLPIAAWGDSQTGATYDGVRWPAVMGTLLGLPPESVSNKGFPGETSVAVAAKSGAAPATLSAPATIPTSGYVEVILNDHVAMMRWWSSMVCTLAGVPGTLTRHPSQPGDAPSTSYPARFTPSTYPAAPVAAPTGAPFLPTTADLRQSITLIMTGRNNTSDVDRVVADTRAMVEYLTGLDRKFAVLPQINGEGRDAINAANAAAYGPRYWGGLLGYLTSQQALTDAGITPTSTDLSNIAAGNLPASFLTDTVHMNGVGLTRQGAWVAQKVIGAQWLPVDS